MTKKDLDVVARAIKQEAAREFADADQCYRDYQTVKRVAETLADTLKAENSRFNRVIFLGACGFPPKGE